MIPSSISSADESSKSSEYSASSSSACCRCGLTFDLLTWPRGSAVSVDENFAGFKLGLAKGFNLLGRGLCELGLGWSLWETGLFDDDRGSFASIWSSVTNWLSLRLRMARILSVSEMNVARWDFTYGKLRMALALGLFSGVLTSSWETRSLTPWGESDGRGW